MRPASGFSRLKRIIITKNSAARRMANTAEIAFRVVVITIGKLIDIEE
jgi:hypothetical protein